MLFVLRQKECVECSPICFILLQCITVQRNTKGENMPTQAPVSLCRDFDFTDKCTRCTWRDPKTPIQLSCLCCCCSRCIYILSAPASARYRWFPLRTELSGFSEAALIPSVPVPPPSPLWRCTTIGSAHCSKSGITAELSLTGPSTRFTLNTDSAGGL